MTLLAGGLVGHRRAAGPGLRLWAAVRYGLLVAMVVASGVAGLRMALTLLLFTSMGGWSI